MNRRNFLNGLLTAIAGFFILPPATTYSRIWKAQRKLVAPACFDPFSDQWSSIYLFKEPSAIRPPDFQNDPAMAVLGIYSTNPVTLFWDTTHKVWT